MSDKLMCAGFVCTLCRSRCVSSPSRGWTGPCGSCDCKMPFSNNNLETYKRKVVYHLQDVDIARPTWSQTGSLQVDKEGTRSWQWLRSVENSDEFCGSELLIAKFRLKLKKTTRPFRYGINQIPSDYTVEVRNGFKGLDLIDRVPDGLWTEVRDIVQETRPFPWKIIQKSKMAVWGGLTNTCEKKRSEKQRRKGKIFPFEFRVPKNNKER